MPPPSSAIALAAGLLVVRTPTIEASTILDFLDRIGGCHKPMHESFSYEVSPYTPKPYGKALSDWTNEDLAAFRAYFIACQTSRPNWGHIGASNRNEEIRQIDTAIAELHFKVDRARGEAQTKRAQAAYEAEKPQHEEEQQRAEADAEGKRLQAEAAARAKRAARNEEIRRKVVPLLQELLAFQNELERLPIGERLARLDAYIVRIEAVGRETADSPFAKTFQDVLAQTRTTRDQVAATQGGDSSLRSTESQPSPSSGESAGASGPYTDFEILGQGAIVALTNPLQREEFRASLSRGIDFNVGVSAIEPSSAGWLVQLSGRLGVAGKQGQGFFCRVDASDAASLAVLRSITPPYGIVHVRAPAAETFLLESEPLLIRIVLAPCQVAAPLSN